MLWIVSSSYIPVPPVRTYNGWDSIGALLRVLTSGTEPLHRAEWLFGILEGYGWHSS